MVNNT